MRYVSNIVGPKRGVSLYSYGNLFNCQMTLEDCMMDMYDMGAHGIEILGNSHLPHYPNIPESFYDEWDALCEKYEIEPAEYGHWIDNRLYHGEYLTPKECVEMMVRDFKIAHRLGFRILRTKMGVIDEALNPVENWREIISEALPYAEEYDVVMCPEIHGPTLLNSQMIRDYCEFIDKKQTKNFGINIDFSVFQRDFIPIGETEVKYSMPEEIIPLLPYVYCCHAKLHHMKDDFTEKAIPYDEIVKILVDHKWNGYMLSEYEGNDRDIPGCAADQLRRNHILMQRILGY